MFELPYRIGRYHFGTDQEYAGRVLSVTNRPIENQASEVNLVRLEFEVFLIDEAGQRLRDTHGVASRDLVLTKQVARDPGVALYGKALNVADLAKPRSWLVLERRKAKSWIRFRFGERDERDFRQPLSGVQAFDATDYQIDLRAGDHTVADTYVTASVVQEVMRGSGLSTPPSTDTITRRADEFARRFADLLEPRAAGKRRKIHLRLFLQLWNNRG